MAQKTDFQNLLNEISEKKYTPPVQKIIPTESKTTKDEKTKVNVRMYEEDWLDLVRFKNHKVLELQDLEYTLSNAISYGLELLEKKYKIERGKKKVTLKTGKRNLKEGVFFKTTSVDLPNERKDFINDFFWFRVFQQGKLDYQRAEFYREILDIIRKNNKSVFENK